MGTDGATRRSWTAARFVIAGVLGAIGALLSQSATYATPCEQATVTWDGGAGTSNWHDANNWTGNTAPTATDHVCVPSSATTVAFSTGTVSIASLEVAGQLNISGGTLSITDDGTVSELNGFSLSGGTLGGAATVDISGAATWSKGSMADAGVTQITSTATLTINPFASDGPVNLQAGRTLNNAGTITWSGQGGIAGYAGSVLDNSGTFNVSTSFTSISDQSGAGTDPLLLNSGTLTKTSTTDYINVYWQINNSGTVRAPNGGTFDLRGGDGGVTETVGTFGTGVNFVAGTYSLSNASLAGAIPGATVNVVGGTASQVPTGNILTINGGTLGGGGTLDVVGSMTWSKGSMADAGVTQITSTGTLTINPFASDGSVNLQAGRTLNNAGTITWSGQGGIAGYAGSVLDNSGTFNMNAPSPSSLSDQSGAAADPLMRNSGTVKRLGNTGALDIYWQLNNTGTLTTSTGTGSLNLRGGDGGNQEIGGTFGPGAIFLTGTYTLSGSTLNGVSIPGATVNVVGSTPSQVPPGSSLNLNGGTLGITGTLTATGSFSFTGGTVGGTGTLEVAGSMTWSAGTMSGSGTTKVMSTGLLNVTTNSPTNVVLAAGRRVENAGTFRFSGSGYINAYAGVRFDNSGMFEFTNQGLLNDESATDTDPHLANTGTVRKTASSSFNDIYWSIDNDGLVKNETAGTIQLFRGTAGTATGTYDNVLFTTGASTLDSATITGGSRLDGSATLSMTGAPTTVPTGGTFVLNAGQLKGDGTITVAGTLNWTGGSMSDPGITEISTTGRLNIPSGGGTRVLNASRELVNKGLVSWTGTASLSAHSGTLIYNEGTIDLASDAALVNQAGAGVRPELRNLGTVVKSAGAGTSTLDVTFKNPGILKAQSGVLQIAGALDSFDPARRLLRQGEYIAVNAKLRATGLDVGTNRARVVLDGSTAALQNTAGTPANALATLTGNNDSGELVLKNGASLTVPGPLANSGTIAIGAASSLTATSGISQSTGSLSLDLSSSTVAVGSGNSVTVLGGTLQGIGTISGNVSNSGTVKPNPTGIGTLSITGSYTQSNTGTLDIDVAGPSGVDQLAVSSAAALDGTVRFATNSGYTPATGDRYTFLTHGSRTGNFSETQGADLSGGLAYFVEHDAGSVAVEVRPDTDRQWGSMIINSAAARTNSRDVSLAFTVPGSLTVTGVRVGNESAPTGPFQPYSTPIDWTLSNGDGTKTVYVQFRDSDGNHSVVSFDDIILDTTAPQATITAPPSVTGAAVITFDEPVTTASASNMTLELMATHTGMAVTLTCRDATNAVVACATAAFTRIEVQPSTPLAPVVGYTLTVNPTGVGTRIRDLAGNPAATTTLDFYIQP